MGEKIHKLRVVVWGEAPDTAEERKLLRKVDFFILTYCCIAFFFNYLDRAVLANAYVSGMKEDTNLTGNQYNLLVTCLSVGYIVGQVPHALVIQKVPPRIWFPLMTLVWALLTMVCAACHSFSQLAAVRFFQGMAEASTYSGTQYIIGSWYKGNEAGKRIGLFQASGMVGTMFSGVLMTAIWSTMDGLSGLPGWRWSFIIDGIVTVPVAVFGFVFFPDLPESTKAFYLNAHERELAVSRLPPKNPNGHNIGFSLVKRVLFTFNFWIFTMFWVLGGALEAFTTQTCMVLWMKASKLFTVPQNNTYPLGITAIGIVLTLFTSVAIDATGAHAPYGFFACGVQIIACIILLCWDSVGVGAKMGAFYLAGTAYMIQPVVFVWANKILSYDGDDAARAIILYSMNGASSVLFAFWGIVLYPTTDAATGFRKGTIAMIVVTICLAMWICIVWWQDKRTQPIQMTQGILKTKSIEEEVEMDTKQKADQEV
ncbi:major facilitator superfamily domain-containing protein [Talaromyces proteolyticus]|uniref:Major facilitator superfamily domain-containing protein n=1 Tax=Talaromyces proteolyticus TaxID=1131652 RepID=A0AAD4KH28_9EURO|nr:major facilitator superfamily domain-containing protein [Talaromyces proteolyticus]KAH8690933.1 major facilitator superfamily domain-containing protein [Talaromyces proteolyticus]